MFPTLTTPFARRAAIALVALTGLASCADPESGRLTATGPVLSLTEGATLVSCPTSETQSARGIIGSLGGSLSVGGSSITLPAGAVLLPIEFTLTIPASEHMAVQITASGAEHLLFDELVTIRIDYSRCDPAVMDAAPLTVWYVDSDTKAPLEDMGGVNDPESRTISFGTGHLSEYAIAN